MHQPVPQPVHKEEFLLLANHPDTLPRHIIHDDVCIIHDADKSKLHDFLLSEKLTENLVYGYAEQDIVYRRIESEKSYIKMRAKKYVDIKDNIAMITLHNVKRTYRSVMEMKRELQKNESDKKKHSKGLTIDKLNALSYEICRHHHE